MADPPSTPGSRREVLILANPIAGAYSRPGPVRALVRALAERGLEAIVCSREELTNLTRLRAERLRCVVAAGGDGTLNDVLNRVRGVPVTVLPLGTENLVARHAGLTCSPVDLAEVICRGVVQRLDLGCCDGRCFAVMLSAGFDARVVHDVHAVRRGHIQKWNYAFPIGRALSAYRFPLIEALVEETGEPLQGATVFLFNLPLYALGLRIGAGALPDDGRLDLLVFRRPGYGNLLRYLAAIVQGRHRRLPDVEHRRVQAVRLSSPSKTPVQTDGDPAGMLPVRVEVVPKAWELLVAGKG